MQAISRSVPAPAPQPLDSRRARRVEQCRYRGRAHGGALRARGGGEADPVAKSWARKDGEEELEVVRELEALEEEAIGGGDEGRRAADYDRRAHIFEESSRVFQALKRRSSSGSNGGVENDTAFEATQQQEN